MGNTIAIPQGAQIDNSVPIPSGADIEGSAAPVSAAPVEPDRPGFLATVGSNIKRLITTPPSSVSPYGLTDLQNKQDIAQQSADVYKQRKTEGYNPAYRIAAPVAEALGVNVPGMEESARRGDVGGVLGHAATGAALAVAPVLLGDAATKGTGLNKAARVTGKVVKAGAKLADVTTFERLSKGAKVLRDTGAEIRDVLKEEPASRIAGSRPEGTGTSSQTSKESSASPKVITDGAEIKARISELLKSPQEAALDKLRNAVPEKGTTVPKKGTYTPDAGVLKSRLQGEAEYVRQAAHEAGPGATVKEITAKAQELKSRGDQFEKTFGQPLENYRSADGSFNMPDFLNEVVKPGTEPPAHVISRVFGSDGVKLVQDVSGKPIEKWQSKAPAGEPKGGSARLRAKQTPQGGGGHAGNKVTSSEELNRPGTNYVFQKNGTMTYHGKPFAPEETPSGGAHVTVLPDGTVRVNAGILTDAGLAKLRDATGKKLFLQ